jgi:hypothetical protein
MKYEIDFQHPVSGERRTVVIKETTAEAECARMHRFWAVQQSLLQRALDQVPGGFEHDVLGGFRAVFVN